MKKSLMVLGVLLSLAVFGSWFRSYYSTANAQADRPSTPVVISGPLPVPVSVAGNVSGSVAATQSGQWNVGITGTPTVNASNPANIDLPLGQGVLGGTKATLVMNVNEARQPVQARFSQIIPILGTTASSPSQYPVPRGKRLVIEWISANFYLPINQAGSVAVLSQLGAQSVEHLLPYSPPATFMALGVVSPVSIGHTVRIYADQLTNVVFTAQRSFFGEDVGRVDFSFTGYLVDVPAN